MRGAILLLVGLISTNSHAATIDYEKLALFNNSFANALSEAPFSETFKSKLEKIKTTDSVKLSLRGFLSKNRSLPPNINVIGIMDHFMVLENHVLITDIQILQTSPNIKIKINGSEVQLNKDSDLEAILKKRLAKLSPGCGLFENCAHAFVDLQGANFAPLSYLAAANSSEDALNLQYDVINSSLGKGRNFVSNISRYFKGYQFQCTPNGVSGELSFFPYGFHFQTVGTDTVELNQGPQSMTLKSGRDGTFRVTKGEEQIIAYFVGSERDWAKRKLNTNAKIAMRLASCCKSEPCRNVIAGFKNGEKVILKPEQAIPAAE